MMSLDIKFPQSHYVGMITRDGDDLPLAFATPDGTDKAAQSRKDSVDQWVSRNATRFNHHTKTHEKKPQPTPAILKNEAMAGFRLLDDIRRGGGGWGQGNVKWRVEDPRGFELEITSPNLMQILSCTVVDKGEILDCCMWAREGKENILVPVSSEVYQTAMLNTERNNKSASLRDVKIGDTVILQNGVQGQYFGKMNSVEADYRDGYRNGASSDLVLKLVPRHIIVNHTDKKIHSIASPKLSEIISGTSMEKDKAELTLGELISEKGYTNLGANYTTHCYTFSKVIPPVSRNAIELPYDNRGGMVFRHNGEYYQTAYGYSQTEVRADKIQTQPWVDNYYLKSMYDNRPSYGLYHNQYKFLMSYLTAHDVKFYRPVSKITLPNGKIITVKH